MKKFEYKQRPFISNLSTDQLNIEGENGWELVSCQAHIAIFKREKEVKSRKSEELLSLHQARLK